MSSPDRRRRVSEQTRNGCVNYGLSYDVPIRFLKLDWFNQSSYSAAPGFVVRIRLFQVEFIETAIGTKLLIVSRRLDTIDVRYMGNTYPVAISATDLR